MHGGLALTVCSRNRGCGLPTARCYNQLGHMSWCQYWIEDIDSPCGARCRNEKGYCELHTKLRPADFEIAGQKNDASYKPTETATNFLQHADVKQLEGSLKQMAIGEQAAEDEAAGQEGKDQTWNEMRTHQNLQDRGILGLGSRLATGDDEQAVAGAEQSEVQEPPTLEPELVGHAGIDESKLEFRKKREPNDNPTKKMNKARKQAEKKLAQEEQSKKSHGKAFKRKKGRS